MSEWPAPDASDAVKPSDAPQSAHGTEPAPSSGLAAPTLSDCLIAMLQRLDRLIDQNDQLIQMMLDQPEEVEEGQPPSHYLNGQRIS